MEFQTKSKKINKIKGQMIDDDDTSLWTGIPQILTGEKLKKFMVDRRSLGEYIGKRSWIDQNYFKWYLSCDDNT